MNKIIDFILMELMIMLAISLVVITLMTIVYIGMDFFEYYQNNKRNKNTKIREKKIAEETAILGEYIKKCDKQIALYKNENN